MAAVLAVAGQIPLHLLISVGVFFACNPLITGGANHKRHATCNQHVTRRYKCVHYQLILAPY